MGVTKNNTRNKDIMDYFHVIAPPTFVFIILKVTPQVRHPERVFLREGSPGSGTVSNISIGINRSTRD